MGATVSLALFSKATKHIQVLDEGENTNISFTVIFGKKNLTFEKLEKVSI